MMLTDYEAISKKNELELGTKLKSRRTQISLYADPTHFVYELLQNADDHGATDIVFSLEGSRLIVEHNGTEPFDARHVAAISSFEDSTSENELLKTGKFGLGFKSVFALTATPRIYCGEETFEIYDLYRLRRIQPPDDLADTLTRFELPFNHLEVQPEFIFSDDMKSAARAVHIIKEKFDALEDVTLLFTRHLQSIRCFTEEQALSWSRTEDKDGMVTIRSPQASERFRLRDRDIEWRDRRHRPVQIAVRLDENGDPIPSYENLVVTFPTSIATGMGIILNGPYRTTPARETVGETDPFNEHLVRETAELLCEMIRDERDAARLTLKFLEVLPVDSTRSDSPGLFSPIHDAIRTMLVEEKILPAASGAYVRGRNGRVARGQYLAELFSDDQLTQILNSDESLHWLSDEVTETNTPRLYRALAGSGRNIYGRHTGASGLVPDIIIRPENILLQLSKAFLETQSDEWISTLYSTLNDAPHTARSSAEMCPIIRLSDGSHVPVRTNELPSAYLPTKAGAAYKTVSERVLRRKEAKEYLEGLGFHEPDLTAEVMEQILPKYRPHSPSVTFKEHVGDLKKIKAVLEEDAVHSQVVREISKTTIVRCVNAANEEHSFRRAGTAYFHGEGLDEYFEGNPDAWFVDEQYGLEGSYDEVLRPLLLKLGVREDYPRERFEDQSYSVHYHGWHERGLRGFHPQWNIDGLKFAVQNPTIERSAFIWNALVRKSTNRISGTVQTSTRQEFPASTTSESMKVSAGGELLRDYAWIPDAKGGFKIAAEIGSVDNLHEDLTKDEDLLEALDEGASAKKENAADVLGISAATVDFIRNYPDEVEKLRQLIESRESHREFVDTSDAGNRERRRQKLKERRQSAPTKESVKKLRSVPAYSSTEIDRQRLFDFYRDEDEDVLFCQMCLDPMPFVRNNGEDCGECVDVFTERWAEQTGYDLRVLTSLKFVLCPVCSEIYRDYVHKDTDKQTALFEQLSNGAISDFEVCGSNVRRDHKDRTLHFNQTHLGDIRDCLDTEADTPAGD
jgi:hypothetical protein